MQRYYVLVSQAENMALPYFLVKETREIISGPYEQLTGVYWSGQTPDHGKASAAAISGL